MPTLPPTEPSMWRKLLSRVHPDSVGSHELFIWVGAVRDAGYIRGRKGVKNVLHYE